MKAKMMRAKLENQFAAVLLWLQCFLFDVLTFPFAGKSFFLPF